MTRSGHSLRYVVVVAALLAWTGAWASGFAAAPATATAGSAPSVDGSQPQLHLSIDSLSPVVLQSNSRVELSGAMTNTTGDTLSNLELRVGLSSTPFLSVDALSAALPVTEQLSTHRLKATQIRIPASLRAGASATWRATLPAHVLDTIDNGVYVLQVSVRSSNTFDTFGRSRIALPWFDSPNDTDVTAPLRLAILLPLSSLPDRTAAGTLLSDTIPRELAGDGRLSRLVDGAAVNPDKVTWVVDPSLLQSAQSLGDGYSIVAADGTPGPPQPGGAAAAWLAKTRAATAAPGVNVVALTYADADVTSLAAQGMTGDITLANTTAPELVRDLLTKPDVRSFAWPTGAATTAETLAALYVAGVRAFDIDRQAFPDLGAEIATAVVETKAGSLSALLGDKVLAATLTGSAAGSGSSSAADQRVAGVAQRQLFLAQTAIYSQVDHRARTIVAPPINWSPDPIALSGILSALTSAPWVQSASIESVLAQRPVVSARTLTPLTAEARRQLLTSKYLRALSAQQAQVALLAAVTAPAGIAADFTAGLLRSESAAWRADRTGAGKLLALNDQQLAATVAKIRPVASSSITFSEGTGSVPVTVANDLKVPVRVGVKLVADPAVRLVQGPAVVIEVPAATKVSAEIPTQVLGAGALPVEIQLTTPDGQNFGKPARTTLRTTAYAKAASYVVVAAFVALTATVVVSSVRRRRRLAAQDKTAGTSVDE